MNGKEEGGGVLEAVEALCAELGAGGDAPSSACDDALAAIEEWREGLPPAPEAGLSYDKCNVRGSNCNFTSEE